MNAKVSPRLSIHKAEHFLLLLERILRTHQSQELDGRDWVVAASRFGLAIRSFGAFANEGIVQHEVGFDMRPVMRTIIVATVLLAITVLADSALTLGIVGVKTVVPEITVEL